MSDFFSKTFYNNTVGEWAIAFAIIIGSVIVARLIYFIIGKFVLKLTSKTKTKLDDIIVENMKDPVVFLLVLTGIYYAFKTLSFSESADGLLHKAYFFLLLIDFAWALTRFVDAMVQQYLVLLVEKSDSDLDDQLLPIVRKSIKISIWVLSIIIGLDNMGYDVGAVIAGLGLGGLAFALAAKDSVSNLFAGFTIFTDKPFKIKDRIMIDGYDGKVEEIGIRSTRVRLLNGRLVTMPNSSLVNDAVTNVTSEPNRKITMDLGLVYDTSYKDMKKAQTILKEVVESNSDLDEEYVTAFTEFGDFSLNLRFIYYINSGADIYGNMDMVNMEILRRFEEAKLEFAFPTQVIYNKHD
jgi:MscS family membrane protein